MTPTITITFDENVQGDPLARIAGPLSVSLASDELVLIRDERTRHEGAPGPLEERYCWHYSHDETPAPDWLDDLLSAAFGEWSRRGDEARAAERAAGWPS